MSAPPWWVVSVKVHVLVEDELTESLLSGAWRDVDVRVDAVGGGETVSAMVKDARQRGARHETENYLLDFDALDALARADSGDVGREATSFANQCTHAARAALRE